MVGCVVEERATLRVFAQFTMHDRLSAPFRGMHDLHWNVRESITVVVQDAFDGILGPIGELLRVRWATKRPSFLASNQPQRDYNYIMKMCVRLFLALLQTISIGQLQYI